MPNAKDLPKAKTVTRQSPDDEVLAVLSDQESGREAYVSLIDRFTYRAREYSVMYHYRPDDKRRLDPQLVIMRSYRNRDGEEYFTSIRRQQELEIVFEIFYERFRTAEPRGAAHGM